MKAKITFYTFVGLMVLVVGYLFLAPLVPFHKNTGTSVLADTALAAEFDKLSKNGNSSCSGAFKDSIASMGDSQKLQGSCCSAMVFSKYKEQVEGLKKYKDYPEIPSDPYNIDASIAKKMTAYYDVQLSAEEQKAYDYAMANSMEKGPCCCKCWRWYVYGGLAKYLIQKYHLTGQQITEVWNLSDGCGGAS